MFETINGQLAQVEAELQVVTESQARFIKEIGQHLVQAGGKRIRPALYLLCAQGCAKNETNPIPMAVALELIHMATLVHDDVIDHAATRRNRPTANARWGNHASVLTGDYLFSKAFSLIALEYDNKQMMKVLADVICSMCEGEILQHQEAFCARQTEAAYYVRIAKKTADFIAASCELGALVAGHAEADVAALRHFGYALGMAFQITDDILDVTATAAQIGKPAGNDLRQGIITLPAIYALEHSPYRAELAAMIAGKAMSEEAVCRGVEIIQTCAAVEYAYSKADEYLAAAKQAIPACLPAEVRQSLTAVADFVAQREF